MSSTGTTASSNHHHTSGLASSATSHTTFATTPPASAPLQTTGQTATNGIVMASVGPSASGIFSLTEATTAAGGSEAVGSSVGGGGGGSTSSGMKKETGVVIAIACGSVVLVLVCVTIFAVFKRARKPAPSAGTAALSSGKGNRPRSGFAMGPISPPLNQGWNRIEDSYDAEKAPATQVRQIYSS